MAEGNGYLKPKGVNTSRLDKRDMTDGQFRNPPTYTMWGGFTNAARAKFDRNRMTLEKGGPGAVRGRPI
ncbi:MAG: hypothetical protein J2P16_00635 [Mycobacterium sp.]|nr:hypothetical protein [Mycobacterium sp.]